MTPDTWTVVLRGEFVEIKADKIEFGPMTKFHLGGKLVAVVQDWLAIYIKPAKT